MAIKFQYNKTSLNNLNKQLKVRKNALPTLKNKESALRMEVKHAKEKSEAIDAELEKAIRGAVGKILEKVTLFDVYKGKQIAEGKKSVSYSVSMRSHDGTLTDEQADSAMKKALKALAELGAELRG